MVDDVGRGGLKVVVVVGWDGNVDIDDVTPPTDSCSHVAAPPLPLSEILDAGGTIAGRRGETTGFGGEEEDKKD